VIVISQTPLRVSFVGGGTDLQKFYSQYDGAVLSTTIDKSIYVIVRERKDHKIGLYYDKTELVNAIGQIQHELISVAMKFTRVEQGVDIAVMSDVPTQGTGLGSSSSLAVGLLTALYAYKGEPVTAEEIARKACYIEIDVLGNPIGKQDQYAAAYGGLNLIRFYQDETVSVEPVSLSENLLADFFGQLFLVNTGMSRAAGDVLKEVKQNIPANIEYMKEMSRLPDVFQTTLKEGRFDQAAELLQNAWDLKKRMGSSISNTAIDQIYDIGLKSGAAAGKLLGAGAGGFMMFMVPKPEQQRFLVEMSREHDVVPVRYSAKGSYVVKCIG
jgi:D-glycero-alpha-D-manno-heptose-7-phosphate kinase